MTDKPTKCPACDGRGYFYCVCHPADCICGVGEETCDECGGEGIVDPSYDYLDLAPPPSPNVEKLSEQIMRLVQDHDRCPPQTRDYSRQRKTAVLIMQEVRQHLSPQVKVEPVAWGAWSHFEQRIIAVATSKMKADTYDGRGDITIVPLYAQPPQVNLEKLSEQIMRLVQDHDRCPPQTRDYSRQRKTAVLIMQEVRQHLSPQVRAVVE